MYWFEDSGPRTPDKALGGPFASRTECYWWFVHHFEGKLSPKRMALWSELVASAGVEDPALLMGLMMGVCAGTSPELLRKCAHPIHGPQRQRAPERMMLAAGDREAA